MKGIKKIIRWYFSYNVDVFVMYVIVSAVYLYKVTGFDVHVSRLILLSIANVLGIIAVHLLNRATDREEDAINQGMKKVVTKVTHYIVPACLFTFVIFLYSLLPDKSLVLAAGFLSFLGAWYSFPRRYRLKNIFLVKNIVPAFSWFFSLSVLIFASIDSLPFLSILKILTPLFFFACIFEILWDMPDRKGDEAAGVKTLPVLFGVRTTKIVLGILLTIFFFATVSTPNKIIILVLILFVILTPENAKKNVYHLFLFFLTVVVLGVNVFDLHSPFRDSLPFSALTTRAPFFESAFFYQYSDRLLSGEGDGRSAYKEHISKMERVRVEKRAGGEQVYSMDTVPSSIVFDPLTFTIAETWAGVPFFHEVKAKKKTYKEETQETVWEGSYTMSPRKGSTCPQEFVRGEYQVVVGAEALSTVSFDGEISKVKVISAVQSESWFHCGISGRAGFTFTYSPDLGVLTAFEGVVYYGELPYRRVSLKLEEIRGK